MPVTTYLANKILDGSLRGVANWTRSSNIHFALFTEIPNASGGGVEVSGGSYSRVMVTATAAAGNFEMTLGANNAATAGNHLFNAKVILWPRPTASWGLIVAYGIYDASTGGNLLWYEPLPQAFTLDAFQRPSFPIRALEFALGGGVGGGMEQRVLNYFLRGVALNLGSVRATLMTAANSTNNPMANEVDMDTAGTVNVTNGRPLVATSAWNAASGAAITNSGAITFSFAPGNTGYTVTHFALVNQAATGATNGATADEILVFGELGASTSIPAGSHSFTIQPASLTLQFQV